MIRIKKNVLPKGKLQVKQGLTSSQTKSAMKFILQDEQGKLRKYDYWTDLWRRIGSENPLSSESTDVLVQFIRSTNEQALNFIGIGDYAAAFKALRACKHLLKTPSGD